MKIVQSFVNKASHHFCDFQQSFFLIIYVKCLANFWFPKKNIYWRKFVHQKVVSKISDGFYRKAILPWQISDAPDPLRALYPAKHSQRYSKPSLLWFLMLIHRVFAPVLLTQPATANKALHKATVFIIADVKIFFNL